MEKIKLAIGADHAGFRLKKAIIDYLNNIGVEVKDHGTYSEESVDYPDFAHPVSNAVENNVSDLGILICGSANGISIAANKHKGIRCAICWQEELAELARQHNDANILALPARFISEEEAIKCVERFLSTPFEGGRHQKRVEKIANC
jgi:ribose 5-phosphate isomerase B